MKKITFLLIILFTINSFSQIPDNKSLIADMNNFYSKSKIEKLETVTTEILSGKYGLIDDELKFYALMYSSNVYSRDEYAKKDSQKGYDKLSELLVFAKSTSYAIPNKEAYIKSMSDYLITYKDKHPEVKESVKEIENNAVAEIKAETVNKTKEINTTEANITPKSTSNDKTVTLTVSGTGKTLEEAKQIALRIAISQTFGAFISSKTELLNDNLITDQITSITNGNIQSFEIINEIQLPNGNWGTTIKAKVSINKLTSFVESKGIIAEIKGGLFALNIKQQILNEEGEEKAICDMVSLLNEPMQQAFDFDIKSSDPKSIDTESKNWVVPLKVTVKTNKNIDIIANYFIKTLSALSLTNLDVETYKSLNKSIYPVYAFYNNKQNTLQQYQLY